MVEVVSESGLEENMFGVKLEDRGKELMNQIPG